MRSGPVTAVVPGDDGPVVEPGPVPGQPGRGRVPGALLAASCLAEALPQVARGLLVDLVSQVPASVSATVVTVTSVSRLQSWASSGPPGAHLDAVQSSAHRGPVFDATRCDDVVVSEDVWGDRRWQLGPPGRPSPIRSVLTVGLAGPVGHAPAVLAVHGVDGELTRPPAVDRVRAALPELAVAVAVIRCRLVVLDLEKAVESNRMIGAAAGVVMASRRVTYAAAVAYLRSWSNDTNTRLVELAEQVVLTGEVPDVTGQGHGSSGGRARHAHTRTGPPVAQRPSARGDVRTGGGVEG